MATRPARNSGRPVEPSKAETACGVCDMETRFYDAEVVQKSPFETQSAFDTAVLAQLGTRVVHADHHLLTWTPLQAVLRFLLNTTTFTRIWARMLALVDSRAPADLENLRHVYPFRLACSIRKDWPAHRTAASMARRVFGAGTVMNAVDAAVCVAPVVLSRAAFGQNVSGQIMVAKVQLSPDVRDGCNYLSQARAADADAFVRAASQLCRLLASRHFATRHIETLRLQMHALFAESTKHRKAAIRAFKRDAGTCAKCGKSQKDEGVRLRTCSSCKTILYCSSACQKAHWKPVHKAVCKALRASRKGQSSSTWQVDLGSIRATNTAASAVASAAMSAAGGAGT
jgi:hypothetical protein